MNRKVSVLPARLRQALDRKGVTIDDLAEKTGLSASGIKKWLGGVANPRSDNLQTAADALEVTLGWLLGEVDDPTHERFTIYTPNAIIGPEPPAAVASEAAEPGAQGGPVGPPLLSPIARPDMLDAAFREALALVGIPAAQLGNPKKLMMLTLILYDRRAKQEADELAALLTEATAAHDKATTG